MPYPYGEWRELVAVAGIAGLLLLRARRCCGFVGIFLLESLDAAGRINQLLLAREEWVALRADFDADQLALCCRASLKRTAAGAMHRDGVIIGVNSFFHERLLS